MSWLARDQEDLDYFEHGNTYYWNADAITLLEHAASSIPEWHLLHPDGRPNLPSLQAFHYFERSPSEYDGTPMHVRIIAWTPLLFSAEDTGGFDGYDHWSMRFSDGRLVWSPAVEELALAVRAISDKSLQVGDVFDTNPLWSFNQSLTQHMEYIKKDFIDQYVPGEEIADKPDVYAGTGRTYAGDMYWWARIIGAMCAFARQRVNRVVPVLPPRPWRRRIPEWWKRQPLVRVIHLASLDGMQANECQRDVEWSCRWMVRGHWRNQFYRSTGRREPLWITEYVKGPEGKPLKLPQATVVAL
jgi:hypothetical protein